jgi:hypothetical protein
MFRHSVHVPCLQLASMLHPHIHAAEKLTHLVLLQLFSMRTPVTYNGLALAYTTSVLHNLTTRTHSIIAMPTSTKHQAIVKETVEPLIDYYRPKGVTRLGFKKVSLGSVPPKVVGVRTLDTNESCAILDLEV